MVYYLRPSSNSRYSMSPSKKLRAHYSMTHMQEPRYSVGTPSESSLSSVSSVSSESPSNSSNEDDSLQHLASYLVIAILVTAVTAVVIRFVIKPDANCVKFLTEDDGKGGVKLSPLKVTAASLTVGFAVSGLTFLAHSVSLL